MHCLRQLLHLRMVEGWVRSNQPAAKRLTPLRSDLAEAGSANFRTERDACCGKRPGVVP